MSGKKRFLSCMGDEISNIFPKITKKKRTSVLNRLLGLGVEETSDLEDVEVEDLTKDGLLKLIQARKLVKKMETK